MPLLKLETNVALSEAQNASMLAALSKITAETIGKPETYVMVTIQPSAVLMSGTPVDAAFVEVRSIGGLGGEVTARLSERTCILLKSQLGIPPDRVYLNFVDVPASDWGWKGGTFG